VHNSIPEYASTTGISIAMKILESSTDGAYKKREKEKEKLQESLQLKGEVNISRGEEHFYFKNPF
jgi:hypothetical protein